jgi:hypothetical protein
MANRYAISNGSWSNTSTWSTTFNGAGGASVPTTGDNAYTNNRNIAIDVDVTCDLISNVAENSATAGGTITLAVDGLTITANMRSGLVDLFTVTANVDLDVVGDLYGGTSNGVQAIVWNSPGTLTITGNIYPGTGGTTASTVNITHAAAVVNVIGNITGSSTTSVPAISHTSTGTLNIIGNLVGGSMSAAEAVELISTGALNITGNVTGGSSTTSYGLNLAGASIVVVNGNVTGGTIASAYGILNSTGTLTINGDVLGGGSSSTYGVFNSAAGTITINGTSTGSESGGPGVYNNTTGTINLVRAKGNSWGPTGGAIAVGYGVVNNNVTGVVIVEEVEYGPNGMIPTLGITFFKNVVTNKCITKTSGGTAGLVPAEEDVRDGVVYAGSTNTGTLKVPSADAVAAGVLIDDTIGTAVITIPTLANVLGQLLADNLST